MTLTWNSVSFRSACLAATQFSCAFFSCVATAALRLLSWSSSSDLMILT